MDAVPMETVSTEAVPMEMVPREPRGDESLVSAVAITTMGPNEVEARVAIFRFSQQLYSDSLVITRH